MMYDVWCMMYDVWCMMYDVWCMMYDVWCMMYDVWCMMYDVWCICLSVCADITLGTFLIVLPCFQFLCWLILTRLPRSFTIGEVIPIATIGSILTCNTVLLLLSKVFFAEWFFVYLRFCRIKIQIFIHSYTQFCCCCMCVCVCVYVCVCVCIYVCVCIFCCVSVFHCIHSYANPPNIQWSFTCMSICRGLCLSPWTRPATNAHTCSFIIPHTQGLHYRSSILHIFL